MTRGGHDPIASLFGLSLSAQVETVWRLPVTIQVTRDVPIQQFRADANERRGVLYFNRTTQKGALVKKGQTFQMTRLNPEEQCRIRFRESDYDLMSCPWRDGYKDHQSDIFKVLPRE